MWRHLASNALTVLIALVVAGGVLFGWTKSQYDGPGPLAEAICHQVPSGTNMRRVSEALADRGAIKNAAIFRIGAQYTEKDDDLKAGSFLVPPGASMREIVDIVTRGGQSTCGTEVVYRVGVLRTTVDVRELDPATGRFVEKAGFVVGEETPPEAYDAAKAQADTRFRIALAEGATSWQIVTSLQALDVLDGEAEIPAEGALAPDSYEVRPGDTVASVVDRMVDLQERRLARAWDGRVADLPLETPEEALVLASIIEKETGVAAERRQVASVFVNRLRQGMRLQTDPTVIYGITLGQGALGRGLRRSELDRETPYNTYVISGLPPTPIANPGLASIEAALDPDQTDYLFFVADGTGGHAFAKTLAEHNANVAVWRRIEAERANQ